MARFWSSGGVNVSWNGVSRISPGAMSTRPCQMAAAALGLRAEDTLVVGDNLGSDPAGGKFVGAGTALLPLMILS